MDTRRIKKLIELVKETGIGELEVKSGEDSVRISCQRAAPASSHVTHVAAPAYEAPESLTPTPTQPETTQKEAPSDKGFVQKSPMVGTAYLAPTPGEKPYVSIGDHINIGDTLCMIEAMKMFNKIEADISGTVSARLIDNESPIEFDQPLFIIDTNE